MNVVFGVLLGALIVGSTVIQFWPAIEALSGGAAAFLGALVGAAAGLGAILCGALYNAKLNRDENMRRRREDSHALAIAIRAELSTLLNEANARLILIAEATDATTRVVEIARFNIPEKAVYTNNTHRIGDLGGRAAEFVVQAHGNADHIRQTVSVALAYPSQTTMRPGYLDGLSGIFLELTKIVENAQNALDVYLGASEQFSNSTKVAAEATPAGASAKPAEPNLEKFSN
jgi:hypothetical protein